MAPTLFSRAWRDDIDRQMAVNPGLITTLHEMVVELNGPKESFSALRDVVSQPWRHPRRDWYDAAALIELGLHMQAGWCVVLRVPLGATPGKDRDQADNQAKLNRLDRPYSAWCASGNADDDGALSWDEPIVVQHVMDEERKLVVRFRPSQVPLEIGHTEPETTIWHIRRDGGAGTGESHVGCTAQNRLRSCWRPAVRPDVRPRLRCPMLRRAARPGCHGVTKIKIGCLTYEPAWAAIR